MSLAALYEAAITVSDNTAGNMLLHVLGGPAGLTSYARTIGNSTTRLDRTGTELYEALTDEIRNTPSPPDGARPPRNAPGPTPSVLPPEAMAATVCRRFAGVSRGVRQTAMHVEGGAGMR